MMPEFIIVLVLPIVWAITLPILIRWHRDRGLEQLKRRSRKLYLQCRDGWRLLVEPEDLDALESILLWYPGMELILVDNREASHLMRQIGEASTSMEYR